MDSVTCANCQAVLHESPQAPADQRTACPRCGSKSRTFMKSLAATLEVKSSLNMKAREAGHREPFLEQRTGDDFFRKAQKWAKRVMRIDRRNDRYTEHVVDPHTNETIHYCDEPLSAHQGHGSAKNKTSNEGMHPAAQKPGGG